MASSTENARSKKEQYWQQQIRGWETSGLKQQEYCRKNGLALATFSYWRRKLKENEPQAVQFYPLTVPDEASVVSSGSRNNHLRLVIGDHRFTIEIDDQFSPSTLQRLVVALEQL